jgi:membrane-associated phospholipid phosphatase
MHERERDRVAPALRGARRRIAALDLAAVRWVARVNSPALDRAMPALSEAANHGKLWIALGACLQATGNRRAGRAARRGLVSLAVASATANIIGKGLASRRRPDAEVPAARRLPHAPWTSSFPSGHAASAAAFAVGATMELPELAAVACPLALAVAASRVVTGVHYPSDVLAGLAIGTAAAASTLLCWPRAAVAGSAVTADPAISPRLAFDVALVCCLEPVQLADADGPRAVVFRRDLLVLPR